LEEKNCRLKLSDQTLRTREVELQLARTEGELGGIKSQRSDDQHKVLILEKENQKLEMEGKELEGRWNEERDRYETEISRLEGEMIKMSQKLGETEKLRDDSSLRYHSLHGEVEECVEEGVKWKTKYQTLKEQLVGTTEENEDLRERIDKLREEVRRLREGEEDSVGEHEEEERKGELERELREGLERLRGVEVAHDWEVKRLKSRIREGEEERERLIRMVEERDELIQFTIHQQEKEEEGSDQEDSSSLISDQKSENNNHQQQQEEELINIKKEIEDLSTTIQIKVILFVLIY